MPESLRNYPWILGAALLLFGAVTGPAAGRADPEPAPDPAMAAATPGFPAPQGRRLFATLNRLVREHQAREAPGTDLLLVVSIDGLRPDAWEAARTPHLDFLAARGAWSKRARSANISRTVPSHVSMVTGLQPQRHRKVHKLWLPGRSEVQSPTIFRWARAADVRTTVIVGKRKLKVLRAAGDVGAFRIALAHALGMSGHADAVVRRALGYLRRGRRGLYFLHFPDVDSRGHRYGWMSRRQLRAVENVDRQLGRLLAWVSREDLQDRTTWLVTADHGGHGKGHSRGTEVDRLVPLILHGAGVRAGVHLQPGHSVVDVAPTVASLLRTGYPTGLDGTVVQEALSFPAPLPDPAIGNIPRARLSLTRRLGHFLERWNPFSR